MKGWLLDTNIISEIGRPRPEPRVTTWLETLHQHERWISILTLAELDQGVEALGLEHPARRRHELFRLRVERQFAGRVLPLTDDLVRQWGALRGRRLQAKLGPAAPLDSMLAATAVHHRLYLVTRNVKHALGLGATIFNPWEQDPARFPLSR